MAPDTADRVMCANSRLQGGVRRENECTNMRMTSWRLVQSITEPTYRDCGLDKLLHLALGRVGPQGPQHLSHLRHLEHGSRVHKISATLDSLRGPNLRVSLVFPRVEQNKCWDAMQ